MTRIRPHFSLRTLAIVVALVAAYFGAWEVTKRQANVLVPPGGRLRFFTDDEEELFYDGPYWDGTRKYIPQLSEFYSALGEKNGFWVSDVDSPGPFIIAKQTTAKRWPAKGSPRSQKFYFWLFGPTFKLPYESEW